ncbi:MAG: hypothetical protein LBS31_02120 [Candidatus Adiutrix sp.]|jgi:hypothetical protein|nr:hypothetical protein [Candidatus Adiutrix sp.]
MIINAAPQKNLSINRIQIGTRRNSGNADSFASGLSIRAVNSTTPTSASKQKNSIYSNFEKEMSRRLTEATKKSGKNEGHDVADPSVLIQSLTGAMGEIEQIFGREAAAEVMAKIITGAVDGITEDSLLSSIQNGLSGLRRRDLNETKMKRLINGFNKDLSLALDPELADKKLENKQTLSLSYAISKHFGSLAVPEANQNAPAESGGSSEAAFFSYNNDQGTAQTNAIQSENRNLTGEAYELTGFNETGSWDSVEVMKLDEASAAELKEAAEAGINKAAELTMAAIMKQDNGGNIFSALSRYLKDDLQDKESAAFVDQCIGDSYSDTGGSSPKTAQMLSQVYSKIAADGEADKLAIFENYINTDFKEALNSILSAMQQGDEALLPGAEVGALQFKGLTGVSLAGENDVFSLNWGYKDDGAYDQARCKRFLQEDIRGVKAVKEKMDEFEQNRMAAAWDDTAEERRLKEAKESKARGKSGLGQPDDGNADDSDMRATMGERFAEERRRNKLEEAMTTKFGQLSDGAREELEKYLTDNFDEEEAEKLLEHTKWSNDLMSGLAGVHGDIRESGADESQARAFMNFLNGTLKKEVGNITSELGGMSFEGWQALDGIKGELKASFKFIGQDDVVNVAVMRPEKMILEEEAGRLSAEQALNALKSPRREEELQAGQAARPAVPHKLGVGYLIDMMA